jgi:hypothetical protein
MNAARVKTAIRLSASLFLGMALSTAAPVSPAPTGFPFADEDLNYSINWPTGISLGEAHLHARRSGSNWSFALNLDAGIPGFVVKDVYHSDALTDLCSLSFDRSTSHGSRVTHERETVDRDRALATRITLSKDGSDASKAGGTSQIPVPACVKDALTFLFYARQELGQGRVPAAQSVLFGGTEQISAVYAGGPIIAVNQKQVQTDQVTFTIKTGASDLKFDIFFARDPARTPVLITAPLPVGKLSMELIR